MNVRRATPHDEPSVLALLARCGLPSAGVRDHLQTFWLAEEPEGVVGTAGIEVYGDVALLRSVATAPWCRNRGIARRLCREALAEAGRLGVRQVYLLTETAADYFARQFGFQEVPRAEADPRLQASQELASACPQTARLMVLALDGIDIRRFRG
ncbi:MAG: arsenic resistance N-acetyltransferase ArsN2 [bacterium]